MQFWDDFVLCPAIIGFAYNLLRAGWVGALSSLHYWWYCYNKSETFCTVFRVLIIQLKMKLFEIIFKMLSPFKEFKLERHLLRWLLVQILFWCMSITKGFQYASIKVKLLILLFWFFPICVSRHTYILYFSSKRMKSMTIPSMIYFMTFQ